MFVVFVSPRKSQEERWKPAGSLCFREPQTRLIGPSSGVTLDASVHPVSRNFGGLLSTPGPQGFLNPQNIKKALIQHLHPLALLPLLQLPLHSCKIHSSARERPPMILCDLRGESTQVALEDKKRKSCLR
ncbi:unnamed protein product [Natator depressus]